MTVFQNVPTFEMQIQHALADSRQPFGVGLFNLGIYQTPLPGGYGISGAYRSTANSTGNDEATATTAAGVTKSHGLVVGFQQ